MADVVVSESSRQYQGAALVVDRLCKAFAIVGGITLTLMALMSLRSIVGRSLFESPLVGDYELVQIMSAVAVGMTLPYAHWIGAHVIVDFFTAHAKRSTNAFLDLIAHILIAFFSVVIAWRLWVGLVDLRSTMDASMMLGVPTWWAYVPLVLSFALLAVTALFGAKDEIGKLTK